MVFVTLGVTLEAIVAKALTAVAIEKIKPGTARQEVPDKQIPGLYLVVQVSGKKSWAVRYRFGGKSCKLTLGQYPAIDLKTARKRAGEARDKVAEGKDPGAEKKAAKAAASIPANDLVEAVADRFLAQYVKRNLKPSTCREVKRILNKVVVPAWEGRRLSEVRRPDVHDLLDEIVARGSPIAANRTLSWFRRMCAWAIERGIIETSPCDKVKAPSTETSRDRVLSDGELAAVWRAAGAFEPPYGAFVRLLVLTGARRNEVAGMTWRELDLDGKVWTLPAARTKNGREHLVPLSEAAVELIRGLPRIAGSEFVFTLSGRGPMTAFDLIKKRIDERLPPDMPAWTYHDLRRTMASGLARLMGDFKPGLVILDVLADMFAGEERSRPQTRQFANLLHGLTKRHACAVLLLAHPSLTGMNSGSGMSGSTDWNNAFRSRCYFHSPKTEQGTEINKNLRIFEGKKNNRGELGGPIEVKFKNGLFVPVKIAGGFDKLAAEQKADDAFLRLVAKFKREDRDVSPNKSPSFAPAVFSKHPDGCGISSNAFSAAMDRLLGSGKIKIETFGPPSRERKRLILGEENGDA